jgi:hypothetical protein
MSEHALTTADASFARLVAKVGLKLPKSGEKLPADYLQRRYDAARLLPDDRVVLTEMLAKRGMMSRRWVHDGNRMRRRQV